MRIGKSRGHPRDSPPARSRNGASWKLTCDHHDGDDEPERTHTITRPITLQHTDTLSLNETQSVKCNRHIIIPSDVEQVHVMELDCVDDDYANDEDEPGYTDTATLALIHNQSYHTTLDHKCDSEVNQLPLFPPPASYLSAERVAMHRL